ncbi:hypothetical protein [Gilliamella sp. ESL0254]|uniref:hypothetical protein n=1 Tax=Gilliamella sp. ESL0254 TaxID=2705035 RepID=UPI0015810829|nr:hypothetical protein [Gilliamella sp. ESL0254]NUF26770.1 hypothetical protein [Gilliamella sp. ESL0254]
MASGIWHLACQTYALILFQFHRSLKQTQFLFSSPRSFRVAKSEPLSAGLSPRSRRLPLLSKFSGLPSLPSLSGLSGLLSLLRLFRFLKSALFFVALLLLSYTQSSVALTPCSQPFMACTSRVIEGSAPYLAFNYGLTKATDTDSLLSIRLEDGRVIRPSTNTSSVSNPISLPRAGSRLGDIGMIFPPLTASSVSLSDLATRFGYWRDDDGDEPAANGISGSISASFTDKDGNDVSFNEELSGCKAPYRVTLSSTEGYLQTQYGVPNRTNFSSQRVTYYINPYGVTGGPVTCYFASSARPNLVYGTGNYAGPSNIWDPNKGFLTQSTDSSSYDRNFPTTGADGLYFDLEMPTGVNASQLTWSVVTNGDITATVTSVAANDRWIPSVDRGKVVARVKLSGPRADDTQKNSSNPSPLDVPSLPQTFELVGRDSRGHGVRYGFVLKQWFVNRGNKDDTQSNQSTWCSSLGYRLPRIKDLTNAKCGTSSSSFPCVNGIDGATPNSSINNYMRYIGAGFFTEWGYMSHYADLDFGSTYYWTSDNGFDVSPHFGRVFLRGAGYDRRGLCSTP